MDALKTILKDKSALIEEALDKCLPRSDAHPAVIHEAMRYAVLGGGKRIRPVLTLSVSEMLGGSLEEALVPACAIEMIHAYSLIHDDLPVMDDDDVRRGRPTCHKKFGEDIALLTGDALLTLAFQTLSGIGDLEKRTRINHEIARAAGTAGMIGGQVLDIKEQKNGLSLDALDDLNRRKTGELIKVSCLSGAIVAGASDEEEARILRFGSHLGFAFQIVDDIIDRDGYLSFMSERDARKKACSLVDEAKRELSIFQPACEALCLLTDAITDRKY